MGLSRGIQKLRALKKSNDYYLESLGTRSELKLLELSERRRLLLPAFFLGLAATGLIWIVAWRFPEVVAKLLSTFFNSVGQNSKLATALIMLIPFAPPFVAAFAIGHLLFPAEEAAVVKSEIMSGYDHMQKSNKRWYIVIAAGMCGALNCLCLMWALGNAIGF